MKECTEALMNKLESIDEYTRTASLVSLFPQNKDKRVVFEKFYTYAENENMICNSNWNKWGYVTSTLTHNITRATNLWQKFLGIFK